MTPPLQLIADVSEVNMDDHVGNMSHWTKSTPGFTKPISSKRASTISLEDPYLAVHEHYAIASQHHQNRHSPPAQQVDKPALGLLVPEEVYHYDPSPVSSPNVDCPLRRSSSGTTDSPLPNHDPLHDYLNHSDNGERRMLGLMSKYMPPEQLPMPVQEETRSWLETPSTLDSSWEMVESPEATNHGPSSPEVTQDSQSVEKTTSWDVIESPSKTALEPSTSQDPAAQRFTDPSNQSSNASESTSMFRTSRLNRLLAKANIEADPLKVSTFEPSDFKKGAAYQRVGSSGSTPTGSIGDTSKTRTRKKHTVRLRREEKKKGSGT